MLHRSIGRDHFDAAVSVDHLPDVDADVVIVLPGNDDPTGEMQVHRHGNVEVLPLDADVLATVLDVVRGACRGA